ncbi:MAG: hypothetical protein NWF06_04315 [Candidatus Bathyarchaeota archaeon]|nr:hypothetical protein [Candidatus Bathyarchaeum sp.]
MTKETKPQTEETQQPEETQTEEITKLPNNKPSDFKFQAAYLAYSKTWDTLDTSETRAEVNDILVALSNDEMSYSSFYQELDDYRNRGSKHYEFSRERIETQRKRDWRQKQTRSQRNQRHKGRH